MSGLTVVGFFLCFVVFTVIMFSLWLRIAMRYLHVSALHPVNLLIHTITDPLMKPFTFFFRKKPKPKQRFEPLTILTLIVMEFIKMFCLSFLAFHTLMPIHYLLLYVFCDLIIQPCYPNYLI